MTSNRPNNAVREYITSVATKTLDEFVKEGIDDIPEHVSQAINEKGSPYLAGFAMGINMATDILSAMVSRTLLLEKYSDISFDEISRKVLRTAMILKAIEYVSCRTLFDRGYVTEEEEDEFTTLH